MTEPAFEVRFRCSNCGHLWTSNFDRGYDVLTSNLLGTRVLHGDDERQVYCPHCDSRHVFITQRVPLPIP